MTFYDPNGYQLTVQQFIDFYEPFYYLNTPNVGRRITARNKTSHFIETTIENILLNGLTQHDLIFIIAWKIGAIDHQASQANNRPAYKSYFNRTLQFVDQYNRLIDVNHLVNYLQSDFKRLTNHNNNYLWLFNQIFNNRGNNANFGLVYCLSLVYFFSNITSPIYDKYAHIGLKAYLQNVAPGNIVSYQQIQTWNQYQLFCDSIKQIFGNQAIQRNIDRSLWVYGHFFPQ
jgi:AAA+ ATPase superfamily predicted ATPase